MEVHHLVPESEGGTDDIDNAIPLCFDCHSEVMRYDVHHPRGSKYKVDELKTRRDQVYEEFTRHLVPPLDFQITNKIPGGASRIFPDVGFVITHRGDSLPVRVRVLVESVAKGRSVAHPSHLYNGESLWNLNPRMMFSGHFDMPESLMLPDERLELRVSVSIVDRYDREHHLLPVGFVYVPDGDYWYAEP